MVRRTFRLLGEMKSPENRRLIDFAGNNKKNRVTHTLGLMYRVQTVKEVSTGTCCSSMSLRRLF